MINNAGMDFLDKLNDLSLKNIMNMVELDSFVAGSMQYLFLERWIKGKNTKIQSKLFLTYLQTTQKNVS